MAHKVVCSGLKTSKGTFLIETTTQGLYRIRFPEQCGPIKSRFASGKTAIGDYFKNPANKVAVKLDLSGCTEFEKKVYMTLRRVPAGKVISYGALAKRAGYPGAARAVGSTMRKNRLPIVIPCHRVVRGDGSMGQYSGGVKWKRWLLEHEGVFV